MYSYGAMYRYGVGSTLTTILVIVGLYYLVWYTLSMVYNGHREIGLVLAINFLP